MAGWAYWKALAARAASTHWSLFGFAIGMALWAKYFVVVLAAPLALFVLFDRDARKAMATAGPYVAAMVAFIVAAPHLLWLVANDFLPFAYADARRAALPRSCSTTSSSHRNFCCRSWASWCRRC